MKSVRIIKLNDNNVLAIEEEISAFEVSNQDVIDVLKMYDLPYQVRTMLETRSEEATNAE